MLLVRARKAGQSDPLMGILDDNAGASGLNTAGRMAQKRVGRLFGPPRWFESRWL